MGCPAFLDGLGKGPKAWRAEYCLRGRADWREAKEGWRLQFTQSNGRQHMEQKEY